MLHGLGQHNRHSPSADPILAAFNRIKNIPGLEAFYPPYIPGVTPNFTQSGGFASAVLDSSGKVRPLLQASGAAQPSVNVDGSLTTNGTSQFMTAAFSLAQPSTIFSRFKIPGPEAAGATYIDGGTAFSTYVISNGGTLILANAGTGVAGPVLLTAGAYATVGVVYNGASSIVRIGALENTGNAGATSGNGYCIGGANSTAGFFGSAQYAFPGAVFSRVLSPAERLQMQQDIETICAGIS